MSFLSYVLWYAIHIYEWQHNLSFLSNILISNLEDAIHTYTYLFFFLLFKIYLFYYVNEGFVCIYVCSSHVCLMPSEVRRGHCVLGLELKRVVSGGHMSAGVLRKSNKFSYPWSQLSSSAYFAVFWVGLSIQSLGWPRTFCRLAGLTVPIPVLQAPSIRSRAMFHYRQLVKIQH